MNKQAQRENRSTKARNKKSLLSSSSTHVRPTGVKRKLNRIVPCENADSDSSRSVLWFSSWGDMQALGLEMYQFIRVAVDGAKNRKVVAMIDVSTQVHHHDGNGSAKSVSISDALARNLGLLIDVGDNGNDGETLLLYLKQIREGVELPVAKRVTLSKTHLRNSSSNKGDGDVDDKAYGSLLAHEDASNVDEIFQLQALDMIKATGGNILRDRCFQCGCTYMIRVCDAQFYYRVEDISLYGDLTKTKTKDTPFVISDDTILEWVDGKDSLSEGSNMLDIQEIVSIMSKTVVGCDAFLFNLVKMVLTSHNCVLSAASGYGDDNNLAALAPVHGILIHGQPGTGKTHICLALSDVLQSHGWHIEHVNVTDVLHGEIGSSESRLRSLFISCIDMCMRNASRGCLVFIDDLHTIIASSNVSSSRTEKQIVSQLVDCFNIISHLKQCYICVVGMTNEIDAIDGSLRRVGRFEREMELKVPSPESKKELVRHFTSSLVDQSNGEKPMSDTQYASFVNNMAENMFGVVAADLFKWRKEADILALERQLSRDPSVNDFHSALATLSPSLMQGQRGWHMKSSNPESGRAVMLDDLAGMDDIITQLRISILYPLLHRDKYRELGIRPPRGVLLHGPPGCGKTQIAQAIANEAQANFVSVQCPDIISKVVGQSSRAISDLFKQSRTSSPCVLFFDQFEAIARSRGTDSSTSQSADQMLSTLLIEMDGVGSNNKSHNVIVLAATNRIDMLDPAILRPGRIDQHINIPLPDQPARKNILRMKTGKMSLDEDVDICNLSSKTEGCSGADIENLCRVAAMQCLRENINALQVKQRHFHVAIEQLGL